MAIKDLKTDEVTFQGCVLYVGDKYLGHDRYLDYAKVWNGTQVIEVEIGHGYCDQTSRTHSAVVDATDEVKDAVKTYEREQENIRFRKWAKEEEERIALKRAETEALQNKFDAAPSRGSRVIVTSGRNKRAKKGETGVVFWKGVNKFKPNKISVGVEFADGEKVYLDSTYVTLDLIEFIHSDSKE